MTILLLDVGNSRLKWALAGDGAIVSKGAVGHAGDPAAALVAIEELRAVDITSAWAANVTGAAHGDRLAAVVHARYGVPLHCAAVQSELEGLTVAYADPSRLGVDRWLMMLALWCELRSAFVIASAGTALTFDAVDAHGRHLGGVIAPGLVTSQQAVLGATRFAASGPDQSYATGLGADTEACVRQGALHACAGLIERLASRFAPEDVPRVLAGGDAEVLALHAGGEWSVRADLVFDGLRERAQICG
jgi:type III pantothenate kinase